LKKKRFKFQVELMVADLSHVPFVNAVLFAKARLLDGGNFSDQSQRVEVINHHAVWGKVFSFVCRIAANQQTGILEPCLCRVSIRKELKGGKSFHKLGFVDVNLSEYAGSGVDGLTRSYLLEGYNAGCQRQDNSLLRINVSMVLQSADPCFKVPPTIYATTAQGVLNPTERRAFGDDHLSINSVSSGFDSLGRRTKNAVVVQQATAEETTPTEFAPGHSRNSSQTSHHSQGSVGYGSGGLSHSRQSSSESGNNRRHSSDMTVANSSSSAGTIGGYGPSMNRLSAPVVKKRIPSSNEMVSASTCGQSRIDSTRVDASELIDELMKDHDLQLDGAEKMDDSSGLQLLISREDGSATVVGGSRDIRSCIKDGLFEQVIIDDDVDRRS